MSNQNSVLVRLGVVWRVIQRSHSVCCVT